MAEYDTIIRGGTIVDGMRVPRYISDLAIKNGKIAKIGSLQHATANNVLDASGLIVAPGFIDLHTHYDAQIQWDPYCTTSSWHGATSVLIGNCGFGFAPCRPEDRDRAMLTMTRNEAIPYDAMKAGMLWDWVTLPEFMDSLDRIPKGVNAMTYVPLTPLYVWTMGKEEAKSRRPTDAELKEMCRLLSEGLDAGARGWSAQVFGPNSEQRDYDGSPMITDMLTDEEILAFARVLGERDEGFIELAYRHVGEIESHAGEAGVKRDLEDLKFYERVAEVSRRPVLYQAVSAADIDPEGFRGRVRWLEDCRDRGLRVYGQGSLSRHGLEFTFADFNLYDDSPNWREATLGSVEERKRKMQDPGLRAKMRVEWDSGYRPGAGVGSLDVLVVTEVGHGEFERYVGLKVGDFAAEEGKHVVDAVLDLAVSEDLQTEFFAPLDRGNPQHTAELLKSPIIMAGISDGGAHVKFRPGGIYPTEVLLWLVRDEGLVSLEEAHYKLSYFPAFCAGFWDRGFLREGAPADIVVYDLDALALGPNEIVHDLPGGDWRRIQRAEGYRWILVNGQPTFEDGKPTGAMPGKFLRHGSGE